MKKRALPLVVGAALVMAVPATANAAPPPEDAAAAPARAHDLPNPLGDKQRELRQQALEQVLQGESTPQGANRVVEVARGQYVELAQEDSDAIWTVLGEFSDLPHNQIEQPDRTVDNTTIWAEDFSQPYFDQLLYSSADGVNSVANFYEELSSGRYTVTGEVEDWVQVPGAGASYGEGDDGQRPWAFVNDTVDTWYVKQLAAGKTPAEIDQYLSQFDVWDRYDHDGDGNFDEADGYIDHFQAVHSGMGEEVGGGVLGEDAIWSHRWYNQQTRIGAGGPTLGDGTVNPLGGTRVGGSRYWIGDYTVEPENGGVGVFAHEFGHDLGLPDLYDTSGNSGGAENSTAFWSLMSSGSYGNSGEPADGIGTRPTHMGAWEKLQLGWLNYEVVQPGARANTRLGPASANTRQAQALVVLLPDREVTTTVGTPFEGPDFWYSGSGDDLDHTMLTAKPAGATTLTAKVSYQIEQDWDYAYAGYVAADGSFTPLPTNRSTTTDPNGQNFGNGITGTTGGEWVDLTADLSAVPDGAQVGFRYWTDGAASEPGLLVDDVKLGGAPATAWTLDGFTVTPGTATESFFNAYIAENRAYTGYDAGLRTGPYNFGDPARPDWAERLPYQDGLLISYWNEQYTDNNVGAHPGAGLILPVDAHPGLLYEPTDDEGTDRTDGESWRPRVQSYDSTFGRQATDRITLHDPDTGVAGTFGGLPAVPTFDDTQDWYVAPGELPDANGWTGVQVPNTGTRITVVSSSAQDTFMQVRVN
ncbi:immune inhibitor A domain-containing protein [Geodermatophilus aquaeductus]|nr:immune inhibitor A domain-containing protein [Geodermatophilus aquaeductus]